MNLFRRLFRPSSPKELPESSAMSIEDVWDEFCRTVRPPGDNFLIRTLERPEFAAALDWLKPPTNCPMAQSVLRGFIDLQRNGNSTAPDEMVFVYQGDKEGNLKPPQDSLDAIANLCVMLQVSATIYYKTGLGEKAEYAKMLITLDRTGGTT